MSQPVANALRDLLQSPNVSDSNGEQANVVDVLADMSRGIWRLSRSIMPPDAAPGVGANGRGIVSLTHAVMEMAFSMNKIAAAISEVASALRRE